MLIAYETVVKYQNQETDIGRILLTRLPVLFSLRYYYYYFFTHMHLGVCVRMCGSMQ